MFGSSGDLVRVYDWDGEGWLQRGGDINGEIFAGFSVSISSDGNVLAIGTLLGNRLTGSRTDICMGW